MRREDTMALSAACAATKEDSPQRREEMLGAGLARN
jgi:hypothetical protein